MELREINVNEREIDPAEINIVPRAIRFQPAMMRYQNLFAAAADPANNEDDAFGGDDFEQDMQLQMILEADARNAAQINMVRGHQIEIMNRGPP